MRLRESLRSIYLNNVSPFVTVKPGTYFLSGHYIFEEEKDLDYQKEVFFRLLINIKKEYDIVDPATAVANLHQQKDKLVALTFDDGLMDCYTGVAPVCDAAGIKALFFVNPGLLEICEDQLLETMIKNFQRASSKKLMQKEHLLDLDKRSHVLGSHTLLHDRLNHQNMPMLEKQIAGAKQVLEEITGKLCPYFAYPFGGVDDLSSAALEMALRHHSYVFSSTTNNQRFEFDGRVINRRHFEGSWPLSHINYFLSKRTK
jgi:peptidoglycan/xylan/chitin deacetylase (PgdA/CDA1 family)